MPTSYVVNSYGAVIPNNDISNVERFGWTVGAGIEYAFTDHWSANVEFRHSDFGTGQYTSTGNQYSGLNIPGNVASPGGGIFGLTFREHETENNVRLGINYHIGAPEAPVVADVAPKGPTAPVVAAPPPPPDPTFIGRLYHAYKDEWGLGAPPDAPPGSPPSRRAYFPPAPEASGPYPFTEWPFGGGNGVGVTIPEFGRQPADDRARADGGRRLAERQSHPDLWLGQSWLQPQQHPYACRARSPAATTPPLTPMCPMSSSSIRS